MVMLYRESGSSSGTDWATGLGVCWNLGDGRTETAEVFGYTDFR